MSMTKQSTAAGSSTYLSSLLESVTKAGRTLLRRSERSAAPTISKRLSVMAEELLSRRGEASGIALAQDFLAAYAATEPHGQLEFLLELADQFGPEQARVDESLKALGKVPLLDGLNSLHAASEPRRQALFRRLNLAPGGTKALIEMRENLGANLKRYPQLKHVDADFAHLFASWFNRGFLVLQRIDWSTPANILEKIIQYEAVHEIGGWDDLKRRLEPKDRRCYAFFHPQLIDEPLIFVEVALTRDIPSDIQRLLEVERVPIVETEADTAVFYSISNTQKGLRGVSFGNFLIKQVVETLKSELSGLKQFATLSPLPRFANWLDEERKRTELPNGGSLDLSSLNQLDSPDWYIQSEALDTLRVPLQQAAAVYLLNAKNPAGRPIDPVAQFHLGNGASLGRINFLGDRSAKGLKESFGVMVNYVYRLNEIEANHEGFAESGKVAASQQVRKLLSP